MWSGTEKQEWQIVLNVSSCIESNNSRKVRWVVSETSIAMASLSMFLNSRGSRTRSTGDPKQEAEIGKGATKFIHFIGV
jgi:hypothetical protein